MNRIHPPLPDGLCWRGNTIHIHTSVGGRRVSRSCKTASIPEARRLLETIRSQIRVAELTGIEAPVFEQRVDWTSFTAAEIDCLRFDGASAKTLIKYAGVASFFGAFLRQKLGREAWVQDITHALCIRRCKMSQCGLPLRGAFTGVVLGQTVIAIAFAIRHLRAAFANLPTEGQAELSLWPTVSRRRSAVCVAATITWARTVGEFGPLLLFVGIVPGQSEVLSTAIYLSWISGDLPGAVVAALLMVALSFGVVLVVRQLADRRPA